MVRRFRRSPSSPRSGRPADGALAALAVLAVVALVGAAGSPPLLAAPEAHREQPAVAATTAESGPIFGFSAARAAEQREREARFDAAIDPGNLDRWMERLSRRPHHVGSPWGKANAEYMAELFRSWGYEARLEAFEVLLPTPIRREVEMLAPERFVASLEEPAVEGDRSSAHRDEWLPVYNAFSADGEATGELVYVNYGRPEDYDELARRGIDVAGKIVIARYGGAWRGIKPKVAAEHGAVGTLIYSDPRDDGYFHGDAYPAGGMRPAEGVQRGSVVDMPQYSGDPLTPGVGATADAPRLELDEVETFTDIPVLPISWADALPLLEAMDGPLAPESWRGALPLAYRLGPGPARVRMAVESSWDLVTAYDVVAFLRGAERPDQWVLRGNHHDAWVHGATDPVAGMVALLEEARVIGELARHGWRPKRTIVYAGWDAEEQGLMGSTEWAETHAAELREKAVAYVNTDAYGRGFFNAGGSHSLERLVNQAARAVDEPELGISLAERLRLVDIHFGDEEARARARAGGDRPLYALGSGSDYTPFLQHLGIASLNLSFGGEGEYGQYHSAYDTYDHFVRFMDPGFVYGRALVEVAGRITLRLADADLLPFEFEAPARTFAGYVEELEALEERLRRETAETNRQIDEGVYEAIGDPRATWVTPEKEEPVPHLELAPLENAVAVLEASAGRYGAALDAFAEHGRPLAPERSAAIDRIVLGTERALTRPEGLPGRPWYVHHLYAPGFYTGYGVKTLPGVREAIEQREWQAVGEQVAIAADVLRAYAGEIDRAAALLEAALEGPAGQPAPAAAAAGGGR